MTKKIIIILTLLLLPLWAVAQVPAKSLTYLQEHNADAWSVMALALNGQIQAGPTQSFAANSATDYEKQIIALILTRQNPLVWQNRNLVKEFLDIHYHDNQLGSKDLLNDDFWGILALSGIKRSGYYEDRVDKAIQDSRDYIFYYQKLGWGYEINALPDSNDTAVAIIALLEAGIPASDIRIQKAVEFLKGLQHDSGGFPFTSQFEPDAASDAWVIMSLNRLGINPRTWQKKASVTDHLMSLRLDDGSFAWQKGQSGNSGITSYAVIAFSGKNLPIGDAVQYTRPVVHSTPAPAPVPAPQKPRQPAPVPPVKNTPSVPSTSPADQDGDGLTDEQERLLGTNPKVMDTDHDGHSDGVEVKKGFDPKSPAPCKRQTGNTVFAYGQRRLKTQKLEKCYADYLSKRLKGVKITKPWSQVVNAFVYGGYSVEDIRAWLKGAFIVSPTIPKKTS